MNNAADALLPGTSVPNGDPKQAGLNPDDCAPAGRRAFDEPLNVSVSKSGAPACSKGRVPMGGQAYSILAPSLTGWRFRGLRILMAAASSVLLMCEA